MNSDNKSIFIAPKIFYTGVLSVAVPIMIQNGITNVVGMLDNVMVGQVGTEAMSGVSIINQLLFVYYLCIFGGLAGIGIFTAQFWGKKDYSGMQYTMRAKLLLGIILTVAGFCVLYFFQDFLIGMFQHEVGSSGSIELTMAQAKKYLAIMYWGMLPMAVTNLYASTLRETGQTVVPMKAGIAAVLVNLIGNYILIYGKLGMPQLGVEGAAIATVISRFVEMFAVAVWTHRHQEKNPYIKGCFGSLHMPGDLLGQFAVKGTPLLLNEALWSIGMTVLAQCYSIRGLTVVAALNICYTLSNVFSIVFLAMGNATAILLGQMLGGGQNSAKDIKLYAMRLMVFTVFLSAASAIILFLIAPFFPNLYNTTQEVRVMAKELIRVTAVCIPLSAVSNAAYFTIRSGGKTLITFLFDSCFCWVISVPAAFILSRYTTVPVIEMYLTVQLLELIKAAIGIVLMNKGRWIQDLTQYSE